MVNQEPNQETLFLVGSWLRPEDFGFGHPLPGGHQTTMERTAVSLYAKELTDLVWKLDKEKAMPKVVVSSHLLSKIPIGKAGLRPSEVVPLGTRMDSLEKVVEKLSLSLVTFTEKMTSGQSMQNFGAIAASA